MVAVFQYMRLLGYPADSISIITSYNGQVTTTITTTMTTTTTMMTVKKNFPS